MKAVEMTDDQARRAARWCVEHGTPEQSVAVQAFAEAEHPSDSLLLAAGNALEAAPDEVVKGRTGPPLGVQTVDPGEHL